MKYSSCIWKWNINIEAKQRQELSLPGRILSHLPPALQKKIHVFD